MNISFLDAIIGLFGIFCLLVLLKIGIRIFIFGVVVTLSQGIAVYIAWRFGNLYGFIFDFMVVIIAISFYLVTIRESKGCGLIKNKTRQISQASMKKSKNHTFPDK